MNFIKKHGLVILSGLVVGIIAVALVAFGNPKNMGFCIACFLRDIAGGVGMHRAEIVQYVRPEIIGLVLGGIVGVIKLIRKSGEKHMAFGPYLSAGILVSMLWGMQIIFWYLDFFGL